MLSKNELDQIISKIDLDGFKEEVRMKNESRGRKPRVVVNHWHSVLQNVSYSELNPWVDDVLTGAGRLSTGNSRVSGEMIFALLKGVYYITTSQIKSFLNRKRIVSGEFVDSDRYCQWLSTCMVSAIKSLDYHTERGKLICNPVEVDTSFDVDEDAMNYKTYGKNWYGIGENI